MSTPPSTIVCLTTPFVADCGEDCDLTMGVGAAEHLLDDWLAVGVVVLECVIAVAQSATRPSLIA